YDGREWRIHYWMFRKDRIFDLARQEAQAMAEAGEQDIVYSSRNTRSGAFRMPHGEVASSPEARAVYHELGDEIWLERTGPPKPAKPAPPGSRHPALYTAGNRRPKGPGRIPPAVKRRYLLLAHRVPVSGNFSLNDLAGAGGRMDEIARATSTAFTVSNGLRRDTDLTILFVAEPPPRTRRVRMLGSGLRYLNPDERSTAALLKNALVRSSTLDRDIEASPGLVVGPADAHSVVSAFLLETDAIWLTEQGQPYTPTRPPPAAVGAVLSDPDDPTAEEQDWLRTSRVPAVSLGPVSLRTSQCIDLLHNRWDHLGSVESDGDA
ncbi:MAG: hypothetical protein L3J97_08175, partial [Thermoplasmata archaeon]|nr:hypothetical protein [Thermoplasmata archaeon]